MLQELARAKINLTLDILGLRPDGYHELETIMQTLRLHDLYRLLWLKRAFFCPAPTPMSLQMRII